MNTSWRDRLLLSFDHRFEKMREHGLRAMETGDPEAVHDCRVAIKRLRALFRLVGSIAPEFKDRERFRRFRILFKAMADIRDLHIQTGLSGELANVHEFPVEEYRRYLHSRQRSARKEFEAFARDFNLERLRRRERAIARALKDVDSVTAEAGAVMRFTVLTGDLRDRLGDADPAEETMHAVRILSKELQYTWEVIDEVFPGSADVEGDFLPRLRKIHQALGRWHDYEIAIGYLRKFLRRSGSVPAGAAERGVAYFERRKAECREVFQVAWREFSEC